MTIRRLVIGSGHEHLQAGIAEKILLASLALGPRQCREALDDEPEATLVARDGRNCGLDRLQLTQVLEFIEHKEVQRPELHVAVASRRI